MANSRKIRVVTFDAMKTLINLRAPIGQIYSDFARDRYRISIDPDALQQAFLEKFRVYDRRWPCFGFYHSKSPDSQKFWWTNVVRETFLAAMTERISIDDTRLNALSSDLYDYFATTDPWLLNESAKSTMDVLTRKGISLAVVSNFDCRLRRLLTDFGLGPYFRAYFLSGETGFAKPDAKLFGLVERLMIADGQEIAHVGDDLDKDYLAAKSLGWRAFLFRPLTSDSHVDKSAVIAEDVLVDLAELKNKI